jgi:hypothetical protein
MCPAGTITCTGACCHGVACCGSRCQTVHDNGVGQSYFDCRGRGTPGNAATYSLALATEAANAFSPGGSTPTQCPGGAEVLVRQSGSQWVTWAYTGTLAGRVNNSSAPTCPDLTSPTWT